MVPKLAAAGLFALATAFAAHAAAAAPMPQSQTPQGGLVQLVKKGGGKVHHHHVRRHHHHVRRHHHRRGVVLYASGSCSYWRNVCANRYGWRTRGFYYCVRRHGC